MYSMPVMNACTSVVYFPNLYLLVTLLYYCFIPCMAYPSWTQPPGSTLSPRASPLHG